jgi:hypothetical protein
VASQGLYGNQTPLPPARERPCTNRRSVTLCSLPAHCKGLAPTHWSIRRTTPLCRAPEARKMLQHEVAGGPAGNPVARPGTARILSFRAAVTAVPPDRKRTSGLPKEPSQRRVHSASSSTTPRGKCGQYPGRSNGHAHAVIFFASQFVLGEAAGNLPHHAGLRACMRNEFVRAGSVAWHFKPNPASPLPASHPATSPFRKDHR